MNASGSHRKSTSGIWSTTMLSVVCWKWKPPEFYDRKFDAEAVNTLYRMVRRNYREPFRFICFTDDPAGILGHIQCEPIPVDFSDLESPLGVHYPSCYRRLAAFGPAFADIVGERFVSLDLDCVIVGRLEPLWGRREDIVFWESQVPNQPYNGSMWLHRCGTRQQVLLDFHPLLSPKVSRQHGFVGSDQAWFSYKLPGEATWTRDDGVVAWRTHCRNRGWQLPPNARIVFFQGDESPWDEHVQKRARWIKEHYK